MLIGSEILIFVAAVVDHFSDSVVQNPVVGQRVSSSYPVKPPAASSTSTREPQREQLWVFDPHG